MYFVVHGGPSNLRIDWGTILRKKRSVLYVEDAQAAQARAQLDILKQQGKIQRYSERSSREFAMEGVINSPQKPTEQDIAEALVPGLAMPWSVSDRDMLAALYEKACGESAGKKGTERLIREIAKALNR